MEIVKLERGNMQSFGLTERQLHEYIVGHPMELGKELDIPDAKIHSSERTQPDGGRLDILMQSARFNERYAVEIQRGEPDESHIVRLLDYLDHEQKHSDEYTHYAVLVAENIGKGRFYNVLTYLRDQGVPIYAVNVSAVRFSDNKFGFTFLRVLDGYTPTEFETEDVADSDETQESASEATWRENHGGMTVTLLDAICGKLGVGKYFTRHYAGMDDSQNGRTAKCKIHPQKGWVWVRFNIPQSPEWDEKIQNCGLRVKHNLGTYYFKIHGDADIESHADIFKAMYREVTGTPDTSG